MCCTRSVLTTIMTSSNGNIFRVTGPLCGEFTGHRRIPRTKASDAGLWCFFICAWIIDWVNNREAGDLRRHRTHYGVTVMTKVMTRVLFFKKKRVLHYRLHATSSVHKNPKFPRSLLNSYLPGPNGRLFVDDFFRCFIVNEKLCG